MQIITEYTIEVFLRKTYDGTVRLDNEPKYDDYMDGTVTFDIKTWDSIDKIVAYNFPNVGYFIIQKRKVDLLEENAYLASLRTPTLIVKNSPIHGRGLFSREGFNGGDVITDLYGDIVSQKDIKPHKYPLGAWNAICEGFYLVRKDRGLCDFVNHSKNPNAAIDFATLEIKALTDIEVGEEVTIDYRREKLPSSYIDEEGSRYL